MSKKIPKLIIYGTTIMSTIIVLACSESISIEDKLVINEKSKQKDIIAKIISPTQDDAKHDAKLFVAIDLAKKNAVKTINDAKTIAEIIKVGKKAIVDIEKAIKNYNDSKGTKHQLLISEKTTQKDIITKIISPTQDDAKHDARLFATIVLTRTSIIRAIETALTIDNAKKIGEKGVITLRQTIKNYNDSKDTEHQLSLDKAKFNSFKQFIVGKAILILGNGPTTAEKLTALTGHGSMPVETSGVNRQFVIQTNSETEIVTITVTFTAGTSTDTTTYKISGFKTININVENGFIYQTKENIIYVGTENGLYKFVNDELAIVDSTNVSWGFMYQTKEGVIYVGTNRNGLKKLEDNELTQVDGTQVNGCFMYQTKEETIYVGTIQGLKKLENGKLTHVNSIDLFGGFMYQTKEGTIYVGTYNKGLKKLVDGKLMDVGEIKIHSGFVYQTKEDVIYVGTNQGLKKFEEDTLKIVDSTNVVLGFMYQTKDGAIYVGTNNKGIKKLVDDKLIDFYNVGIGNKFMLETKESTIYVAIGKSLKKFPKFNL